MEVSNFILFVLLLYSYHICIPHAANRFPKVLGFPFPALYKVYSRGAEPLILYQAKQLKHGVIRIQRTGHSRSRIVIFPMRAAAFGAGDHRETTATTFVGHHVRTTNHLWWWRNGGMTSIGRHVDMKMQKWSKGGCGVKWVCDMIIVVA